jgi:hypothetical protein
LSAGCSIFAASTAASKVAVTHSTFNPAFHQTFGGTFITNVAFRNTATVFAIHNTELSADCAGFLLLPQLLGNRNGLLVVLPRAALLVAAI